jgi:hypothetical protein
MYETACEGGAKTNEMFTPDLTLANRGAFQFGASC